MRIEILKNGQVLETRTLAPGNYKVGRLESSEICLESNRVSKQHALLVIKEGQAAVLDLGSANGVFVNGVLVKKQRLNLGDALVIGEFQIRILKDFPKKTGRSLGSSQGSGNLAEQLDENFSEPLSTETPSPAANFQRVQEQVAGLVDKKILVPLYGLMKVADWRWILASVIVSSLVLSVLLAARPIFSWATELGKKEALDRAHTVLNQIVRENFRNVQKNGDYARFTTEPWKSVRGFQEIYILETKTGNILAPVSLYNKSLKDDYALIAFKKVAEDKESQVTVEHPRGYFLVAQPIPLVGQENTEDIVMGSSAVVLGKFQISGSVTSVFEPVLEALIFSVFLGLLAYFLVLKMISHPIQKIQEQLDAALKGEPVSIACEAKLVELENLAQVINFSVSKLRQSNVDFSAPVVSGDSEVEDTTFIKTIEEIDVGSGDGILLLDKEKKVKFVGHVLEELIGIRTEYARGQNISDCCRDPGFAGTSIDLTERVIGTLGETQTATLDINGINRAMVAVGHRSNNGEIRFILLTVKMVGN